MKRRPSARAQADARTFADTLAAIRTMPALDITAALAAGADPIGAALDAARDHPAIARARAQAADDGRSSVALASAVGALAARTAQAHARPAEPVAPF